MAANPAATHLEVAGLHGRHELAAKLLRVLLAAHSECTTEGAQAAGYGLGHYNVTATAECTDEVLAQQAVDAELALVAQHHQLRSLPQQPYPP